MRKLLLLAFFVLIPSTTVAQVGGFIGLSADQNSPVPCLDDVPGLISVHVIHNLTPGATASRWSAPVPACFTGFYLGEQQILPITIGNSQTGVIVGYGDCLASPIHIMTITLFGQGSTPSCCLWRVLPDPSVASGQVEVVDCMNNIIQGSGFELTINADPTCNFNCVVPTDESSWGRVKSLFVD